MQGQGVARRRLFAIGCHDDDLTQVLERAGE
jgi:hypothetical protein